MIAAHIIGTVGLIALGPLLVHLLCEREGRR